MWYDREVAGVIITTLENRALCYMECNPQLSSSFGTVLPLVCTLHLNVVRIVRLTTDGRIYLFVIRK